MNMEACNARPLEVLDSINYIDSALFGLGIDIFKIRLLIAAVLSSGLRKFGFEDDHAYLCFDFRLPESLNLNIKKGVFCPPYLEDGELAACNLLDFDFERIETKKVGSTGQTERINEYGERHDIHEMRMTFSGGGMLQF